MIARFTDFFSLFFENIGNFGENRLNSTLIEGRNASGLSFILRSTAKAYA